MDVATTDKRQTKEQAADFAAKALQKHKFHCSGDPIKESWLGSCPVAGRLSLASAVKT